MSKVVIGICGRKFHGKDTVAKWFMDYLRHETTKRVAFADPLKRMASSVFGWDGKKDAKGRRFLQLLGTEVGRCYYDNLWVDKAIKMIHEAKEDYIFVTDLRFEHEYNALKDLREKGIEVHFLKVKRINIWWDNFKWKVRKFFGRVHASEIGLPDEWMNLILDNDFKDARGIQEDIKSFCELELGIVVHTMEEINES